MNIIEQLNKVYYDCEWWQDERLSELEITRYHNAMIAHGRLMVLDEDQELIGYVESWRLIFEQFGRIICNVPFSPLEEDVTKGPIAYLANTWIKKEKRGKKNIMLLKSLFLEQNKDAEFFVGEAKRKKVGMVKVFNRKEYFDQLYKKEHQDG